RTERQLAVAHIAVIVSTRHFRGSAFVFSSSRHHRDLHSFPTRRSSDLDADTIIRIEGGHMKDEPSRPLYPSARETVADWEHYDGDRKSTRLNSSHLVISYAVFCLKKKKRGPGGGDESRGRPQSRPRAAE